MLGRKQPPVQDGSGQQAPPVQGLEPEGLEPYPDIPSRRYNEAPIGLCYLDLDLRFVHINKWLAAVNGLTISEHLGRTIREVLPDVARGVEEQLHHVITTGEPTEAGTVEAQTPAHPGVMRTFQHNYVPVRSPDGTVVGVSCAVQDVTERVAVEEELERSLTELEVSNRELEAFSHALAHDLRNPLLIVTNFSHQLHETLGDSLGEQEADDFQRIRAAGRHMMHIIDDLRDLGDVNRVEIRREEVDLSRMGQDIIDDLRTLVPDRDLRFEAEPGIRALGDKTLLKILLTNLLQNAWKYTGPTEDARIELGIHENEGDIPTYYVRDNGIGFDNANGEIIFQAFERLHTRTEFAGSGLGLATVERIVRRHGGRVWGEGVVGKGAVFRFTLESSTADE